VLPARGRVLQDDGRVRGEGAGTAPGAGANGGGRRGWVAAAAAATALWTVVLFEVQETEPIFKV